MGRSYPNNIFADEVFQIARRHKGFPTDLRDVMKEGPLDTLNRTAYTQVAMLLDGYVEHED